MKVLSRHPQSMYLVGPQSLARYLYKYALDSGPSLRTNA